MPTYKASVDGSRPPAHTPWDDNDTDFVTFDGVSFGYGSGPTFLPVVDDVSFTIKRGSFTAFVGPSGCGKTTILNIIAGLSRPTEGTVIVQSTAARFQVAYMLARDALLPWRSAQKNVELPMELAGLPRTERRARAASLLEQVGLTGFENRRPAELSHGMKQRVALARTLAQDPDVLLMDEPFSALDAQTRIIIQNLFLEIWERERRTVLFVTHDLTEALTLADSVFVLSSRPTRIRKVVTPELPRPRHMAELRHDDTYNSLYDDLWSTLEQEAQA
jgi:NitT/TauT family transport system ATP-binding protein